MSQLSLGLISGVALILSLAGCAKPKAGDRCLAGTGSCADPSTFLVCRGGVLIAEPCRGPGGCSTNGAQVRCDESIGTENDACSDDGKVACGLDGKSLLQCANGRFGDPISCRGPKGCYRDGPKAICDQSVSREGERCSTAGQGACTEDHQTFLQCVDNKFGVPTACRGPKACYQEGTQVLCDMSAGQLGDLCGDEGKVACTPDGRSVVHCDGGRLARPTKCRGPKGCYREGALIHCDESVSSVGEACAKEGTAACTADERTFLRCMGGHFVGVACKAGQKCKREGNQVLCAAP